MQTKIIEATNGPNNWGKFLVGRFGIEWDRRPALKECRNGMPLLDIIGWTHDHLLIFDLQTGEGALFKPGGSAVADLAKRKIWVCPLFEPFLTWLYRQNLREISALPDHIDLPDAPFELASYRRAGEAS